MLLLPDRSGWKETCGDLERRASAGALVGIGDEIHEVTIAADGTIDSAVQLDLMPPPNGCTLASARELIASCRRAASWEGSGASTTGLR